MKIQLDKERELKYDANAIADAEEQIGASFTEIVSKPSIRGIRVLLWAGLKTDDPLLTVEAAGRLMVGRDLQQISDKITRAIADFFGK